MIEARRTLGNEFQYYSTKNGSNKNDFSGNHNSRIAITGIFSSYSLEEATNLKRKLNLLLII
jgi:hypothetical protein